MEQAHDVQNVFMQNASVPSASIQPQDWAKLIRKLRWIGMEDEACRLQWRFAVFLRSKEAPYPPVRSVQTEVSN